MEQLIEVEEVRASILRDTRISYLGEFKGEKGTQEYYEALLQSAVNAGDFKKFQEIGKRYKKSFKEVRDAEGNTLIHMCIKSKQNEIFDYILSVVKDEYTDEKDFVHWLEERFGKNRLTALHLAAFCGNVYVIKKLTSLGADCKLKTKTGLNILHMAAQGNQAGPIVFLKESNLRMELNLTDKEGNNPLHWACKCGSLSAVLFLLKYYDDASINLGNNKGLTPLHLSVESALSFSNTGVLKSLLFAGANRHATDRQGRTAMDYAFEAQSNEKADSKIINDIIRVLQNPKECDCLMLKRPIKRTLPSHKLVILLQVALALNCLLNSLITIPCMVTVHW